MGDFTREFRNGGAVSVPSENGHSSEARVIEERKRYTAQLQRKAQAHVTAELGSAAGDESQEIDRQVTMLVQHALETTGARRSTLYRPVPRGRRWQVASLFDDGSYYYGLVSPETLALARAPYERRQSLKLGVDRSFDPAMPRLSDLGLKNYFGMPIVADGAAVGALEVIDVAQADNFDEYEMALEQASASLAEHLAREARRARSSDLRGDGTKSLSEQSVLDLVLRPPATNDDLIEITPAEWSLLNQINGERPLDQVAAGIGMPLAEASKLARSLMDRGLLRTGKEARRRI